MANKVISVSYKLKYLNIKSLFSLFLLLLIHKKSIVVSSIVDLRKSPYVILLYSKLSCCTKEVKRYYKNYPVRTVLILLIFISLITYLRTLNAYFQADEWYFFRDTFIAIKNSKNIFDLFLYNISDAASFNGHMNPLVQLYSYIIFFLFGFNFTLYQIFSLFLHVIAVALIFYFTFLISNKRIFVSFIASSFFAVNATHSQAVSWISGSSAEMALVLALVTMTYLQLYLLNGEKRFKNLSLLFLVLSVFTKETTLFLFAVYPLMITKFGKIKTNILKERFFIVFLILFTVLRIIYINHPSWKPSNYLDPKQTTDISVIIYRFITLTAKSVVAININPSILYTIGDKITIWGFPQYSKDAQIMGLSFLSFSRSAGIELFIYPTAVLLLLLFFYMLNNRKLLQDNNSINMLILGAVMILGSVFPFLYAIDPIIKAFGFFTILDSRHYYSITVGVGIIFAVFCKMILEWLNRARGNKYLYKSGMILFTTFIVSGYIVNLIIINSSLKDNEIIGTPRKIIINKVLSDVPKLNKSTIIYINSNYSYYGYLNNPPFQINPALTFIDLFYSQNKLSYDFLNNVDFFIKKGIYGEGYLRIKDRGLGFYYNEKSVLNELLNKTFSPDDIYAFFWDGQNNKVTDETDTFRKKIKAKVEARRRLFARLSSWQELVDDKNGFSIKYPQNMKLYNFPINSLSEEGTIKDFAIATGDVFDSNFPLNYDGLYIRVKLKQKPFEKSLEGLLYNNFLDGEGKVIKLYSYRPILMTSGQEIITYNIIQGKNPKYFILFKTPDKYFEITAVGNNYFNYLSKGVGKFYDDVELIISTISYPNSKKMTN